MLNELLSLLHDREILSGGSGHHDRDHGRELLDNLQLVRVRDGARGGRITICYIILK